jgi:hypothetical protein
MLLRAMSAQLPWDVSVAISASLDAEALWATAITAGASDRHSYNRLLSTVLLTRANLLLLRAKLAEYRK